MVYLLQGCHAEIAKCKLSSLSIVLLVYFIQELTIILSAYMIFAGSCGHVLSLMIHRQWKSGRFHTGRKRRLRQGDAHGQFLLTLRPLQRGCFQSKPYVVYDKAGVR